MSALASQSPKTPHAPPANRLFLSPRKEVASNVHVICRVRPMSEFELSRANSDVVQLVDSSTICIHDKEAPSVYTYDTVCGTTTTQDEIYGLVGRQTLEDFFAGYNGTILAYGQTGAGKSYTMFGKQHPAHKQGDGLIPRLCEQIFTQIAHGPAETEYTVGVSLMEVYKEHIYDLLDPDSKGKEYTIHEDKSSGVYVRGLSQASVSTAAEMAHVLKQGHRNRTIAATNMNAESSRSHAIFQVMLTQKNEDTGEVKKSHLFLVDLAGSEKVDRTGAVGNSLEEAKKINLSLSVLGLVINSLTDSRVSHVPYRDSKLTRILQESLGGNSRTSLVINISPASSCLQETLSTLRFGSRAKKICNSVHVNTELSVDQLKSRIALLERANRELELENAALKKAAPTSSPNLSFSNHLRMSSRIPLPVETGSALLDELRRKDDKITQLEQELLEMKMAQLKTLHSEDLKLFKLESALLKLNDKLSDVELINDNLRKHLLISEKIIEARDTKIDKLGALISEQQAQVNRESLHFKSKFQTLKSKLDAQKLRQSDSYAEDKDSESETAGPNDSFASDTSVKEQLETSFRTPTHDAVSTFESQSRLLASPLSPKIGLNLHIVKPLRGGQGKLESEKF